MDAQQLATKVAQLESRVATLEDEGKIVKGEVKQILTEIRTAILVRDNPFEGDGGLMPAAPPPTQIQVIPASVMPAPAPEPRAEPAPAPAAPAQEPAPEAASHPAATTPKEPVMLRPLAPLPPAQPEQPQWSLLTIAGMSAWAEDAMARLGSLRLEILLDLCEAAGHISTEARLALARVTELDIPEPAGTPSQNETVVILRQLEALVHDDDDARQAPFARHARL